MSEKNARSEKKILISTIGSRGEVQPAIALALELRALGNRPVLCVPPTFKTWVESFELECVPLGPDVKQYGATRGQTKPRKPSMMVIRKMVSDSIVEQFKVTMIAAQGCDLILTAGDLQHAGKSVAEALKIPHVHATYCPVTLRSSEHMPPNLRWLTQYLRWLTQSQSLPSFLKLALWRVSDGHWNSLYRESLNEERAKLGISTIKHVPRYIANEHSLIAADAFLAPAKKFNGKLPFQTGAWMLRDESPLPEELEKFLAAGEPPIYFGFGSMKHNDHLNQTLIKAARAVGRRAIISKGWGNFGLNRDESDVIVIDDVSHAMLFPRVAAIVHHGGAGTTHAAARAGKPQVIVPHLYDQFYWAHRVKQLGIGVSAERAAKLSVEMLTDALRESLRAEIVDRAKAVAEKIGVNGARIAAEQLLSRCHAEHKSI